MYKKIILLTIGLLIFTGPAVSNALAGQAELIHVNGTTVLGTYTTIQEAVDLAQPGQTVLIYPGVYTETVTTKTSGTVDNRITIKAVNRATETEDASLRSVIDGEYTREVAFDIDHPYYTLDGFHVTQHYHTTEYIATIHAEHWAENKGTQGLIVQHNLIDKTYKDYGSMQSFDLNLRTGSDVIVRYNKFQGIGTNVPTGKYTLYSAMSVYSTTDTLIEYNEFSGYGRAGGMKLAGGNVRPVVRYNYFHDNFHGEWGQNGALYFRDFDGMTAHNNLFENNTQWNIYNQQTPDYPNRDHKIYNNTFVNGQTAITIAEKYYPLPSQDYYPKIYNNIMTNFSSYAYDEMGGQPHVVLHDNIYYNINALGYSLETVFEGGEQEVTATPIGANYLTLSAYAGKGANLDVSVWPYQVVGGTGDTIAPQISITSPIDQTTTEIAQVTVTGTASDNTGVTEVTVNGTAAITTDGYANWSVELTLIEGANTITATAKDLIGNTKDAVISVTYNAGPPPTGVKEYLANAGDLPLSLFGSVLPEEGTVTLNITDNPASAQTAQLVVTYLDADNSSEGYFYINSDSSATSITADKIDPNYTVSEHSYTIDKTLLLQGQNTIRFTHTATGGYEVQALKVVLVFGTVDNTYTITATAGANGSISPSGAVSVDSGSDQTFTITADTGYHVLDVIVDGASVGAVSTYIFSNVTADHTIAAGFAIDTYTITASADANGSISPSGAVTVNSGSNQTFNITANTGYHIDDVLVDSVSVGAVNTYTFSNAAADHSISAGFAIDTYTITASAGANGSISPSGAVTVNSGSDQKFTITANAGYHIDYVLVDGASAGAVTTYTFSNITADHTITAGFLIDPYTIPPVIDEILTSDNTGTVPLEITFTVNADDKDGNIVKYEWDFYGRGRYDTISRKNGDATFTYKTPGAFNPTIKVTDNDGLTAEAAVTIHALPAATSPTALIRTDKTTGTAPLTVIFTGNGNSPDPDVKIVKYEWAFENKGLYKYPSTSKQIIYTYTLPGNYKARLRITDNSGLMAEAAVNITVEQSGNMTVDITKTSPGHDPAYVLDEITYQAAITGITPADNRQITYEWDFDGNGTYDQTLRDNETPKPVTHTYTDAGTYTVKLKITTPDNLSAETDDLQIRIKDTGTPYPEADFTITDYDTGTPLAAPYEWTAPFTISLTDSSAASSSITAYEWDLDGNGIYDTSQQNTIHTYYYPGTYLLTLKITDANGLRDKKTVPVYITSGKTYQIRITDPQDSLTITGNTLTIIAETAIDHPETYQVLFNYKEQNSTAWSASQTSKKIGASYAATLDTTFMQNGQYEITARLIHENGTTLVTSSPVSITIDSASTAPDIRETTQTGSITKTVKIYRTITNKINIFEADTGNITKADIPANILDSPEDTLEIKILDNHTPGLDSAAVQSAREYREYTLNSGQTQSPNPVTITIPYPDADSDGFIDGTDIQETSLAVYWYNPLAGDWEKTPGSVIFPDWNHVQLQTGHFSVFGLGSPVDSSGGEDPPDPSAGGPELEDVFQGGGADGGGGEGCFIRAVSE